MTRRGSLLAIVALGCGLIALAAPGGAAAADAQIIDEQVAGRVVTLTIATPAFNAPTKVDVDVPVGYFENPSRRWPVTYFTAGTMNNYNSFNSVIDGVNLTAGYPSIVVSPDGNSGYWSDWYNGGAFGPPQYETYVIDQLIPLIDSHFRTIPDRSHRVIFGVSMGGYGSMMLAARHPDLFAAAASLSGAVDSNLPLIGAALSVSSTFDGGAPDAIYGPRASQEVRWRGHNPWDLAENLREIDLQVRTANGILNPSIGEGSDPADLPSCVVELGVHDASVSLHQRFDAIGMPHLWDDYGPGCHTPENFEREVRDTLARFERVLANPSASPSAFDYRSVEPRFGVWGWNVQADPDRALEFLQLTEAGPSGLTLTGSGTTTVTTPGIFRGLRAVDLVSEGMTRTIAPAASGSLRFGVDLGPPHPDQQYTAASIAAGAGSPGYFTTRSVAFAPHARLVISHARLRRARVRACIRSLGPPVTGVRLALLGSHAHRVGRARHVAVGAEARCVRLKATRRLRARRYTVRAAGTDSFGHHVVATAITKRKRQRTAR